MRDPYQPAGYGNDGRFRQFVGVLDEDSGKQWNSAGNRDVRQSNYAGVRQILGEDEGAEILVHRNEDTPFVVRSPQKLPVARVGTEVGGRHDIVPIGAQPLGRPAADAAVDQKPQAGATRTASSVSLAMTAWA